MNKERINEYVHKLLKTFGSEFDPNPYGTGTPTLATYYRHSAYGLRMDDERGNKIIFEERVVYDEYQGIYEPGVWEEILEEYYNKIPTILENRRNSAIRTEECEKLYDRLVKVMPLGEQQTKKVLVDGCFQQYHEYTKYDFGNNFKIIHDYFKDFGRITQTTNVFYNSELVFSRVDKDAYEEFAPNYISFPTYIPGAWEKEIDKLEMKAADKAKVMHLDNLRYLRSL